MPPVTLVKGKLNALLGMPGKGKTQAALSWAAQHALSGGHVHWQDYSEGQGTLARRAHAMGVPEKAITVESLRSWKEPLPALATNTLLVVDYLQTAANPPDQADLLGRLRQLTADKQATVLVLGQLSQGGDPGASPLAAAVDHAWVVNGPAEEPVPIK